MGQESHKGEPIVGDSELTGSLPSQELHKVLERTSYLIEESKPNISLKLFDQEMQAGRKGLCITRENPKRLRETFGWQKIPFIWLTNNSLENEHCIDPTNLSRLSIEIIDFIKKTKNGIVLLEGLEYLISQNSYQFILRFIQLLNDKIMLSDCIILIPVDPLILSERELHLLERDMKLVEK